ncbi:MAG: hypothetical protein JNG83_10130 [Opitutaceae bacterium]|nr:hypothetical protein [Opitutaceae bacterium]
MNSPAASPAFSHETLLAIGVTLCFAGIVLRGFARDSRRHLARRKQHLLDQRHPDSVDRGGRMEREPGWLEQHLGLVANLVLSSGVVVTVLAILRR